KASPAPPTTSSSVNDLFNLNSPSYQSKPPVQTQASKPPVTTGLPFDNAWASNTNNNSSAGFGWGNPATTAPKPPPKPTVADDDDFGGFSSGGSSTVNRPGKPVQYDEDLFKNVWS